MTYPQNGVTIEYKSKYVTVSACVYSHRLERTETIHHWDGQNIVMEAAGGLVKSRYLRGIGLIAQQIGGDLFYYLHNAHGDVTGRIRDNGDLTPEYRYDAFGNEREPVETDPNPFRYCGEYTDLETNTLYLRNRSYDPATGRFGREDPIRSGFNWYAYCGNNPGRFIDPSGLSFLDKLKEGAKNLGSSIVNAVKATANAISTGIKNVASSVSNNARSTGSWVYVPSNQNPGKLPGSAPGPIVKTQEARHDLQNLRTGCAAVGITMVYEQFFGERASLPEFDSRGFTNYVAEGRGYYGIDADGNKYMDPWQDYIQSTYGSYGDYPGSMGHDAKIAAMNDWANGRATAHVLAWHEDNYELIDAILANNQYIMVDFFDASVDLGHTMVLKSGSHLNGYVFHDPFNTYHGTRTIGDLSDGINMTAIKMGANMIPKTIYYYQ